MMDGADSFKTFVTIHHTSVNFYSEIICSWFLIISYIPNKIVFFKGYDCCYLKSLCMVFKMIYLQQTMFLGTIVN